MPLPKEQHKYTVDDILALPDGQRAELIDGQIYDMGTPTKTHQDILGYLFFSVQSHIMNNKGSCQAMLAPFSIFLNNDDRNYVEPDLSVICNPSILDEKGCHGAPDWIIEIVSPSSERMDYVVKTFKYRTAGVREYWVIDKTLQKVTVFDFENDNMFEYDFTQKIPVLIYDGELEIDLSRFIMLNQSIRQTPIFPKDVDMKMKLWYNLRRFLYEIKDIPIFKRSYSHIT